MISENNSNLFELITENKNLVFIDAKGDKSFHLNEILLPVESISEQSRSLVFLYLDTNIDALAVYFSFLKSDHALVLLSDSIDIKLKENLEKEYEPTIIYDANRETPSGYQPKEVLGDVVHLELFVNENFNTEIHDNIKILLSTSGTTGSPKLVKLSADNILQNALSICDYLPINSKDVTPINLPLHYSYGLSVLHSNALLSGTIVCGLPDVLDRNFWKLLSKYGFSSIAGVPFIYEMLNRIGFLKKEYPSLKYISQAGGNLSKNIKEAFNNYCLQRDINFFVMYGQTEATARISYVPTSELKNNITSIGIPIKNGKITIDKETEELLYSGPNVFGGYATGRADLSIWEDIKELKTGDLAYKDASGFYHIKGRLKRIVKVFGNRVNLDEIEAFIKSSLNTSLLACTGIDDKIILIAHCNNTIDEPKLKKLIFETYKIQGSAIKFKFFEVLPVNKNDKIDYKAISASFLGA
ncbi:AMP-binding protein [Tamlana agarivorans]|uniref:AMP-binding protein n=1 Tax=Pseudotamlana agarivorans TaxID=481183 RepID=A0ACC5UCC9_9FLAO|nr:AMP-binding protein [Tamlana agarivorans]MBU2951993.1 AMP-binding protein [Tamlana agarivorans]